MSADSILFYDIDPNQLYLEIPSETLEKIWTQTDHFSSPSRRWQAYLHQVCLDVFLAFLREEQSYQANVWPSLSALPYLLEIVNGVAINFAGKRLVLIAIDTIDLSEIQVPQEWVDLPSWAADYYIAFQVNPDDGYLRVFGYTTHRHLKTKGIYDASNRTYCLDEKDLIADLSILWVSRQLCPDEILREASAPLPTLPLPQAENLLERLGKTSVLLPRLEIPFALWGSLIEQDNWRRRLYEKRLGITEQWSVRQWLETGISQIAQEVGWSTVQWQPNFIAARGTEPTLSSVIFSRQLVIENKPYELRVFPQGIIEEEIWRFELRSSTPGSQIPRGFKLRLLTEDLQPFDNNEDIAIKNTDLLFVEVTINSGEALAWEIEPKSTNDEREILRF
ncbi:hypothetical protein C7H19_09340 [Aphanothece hegewaldii CCALA 016]|uniref:DUF1822 domain-containing protein n=1 Tax=Aphanothece hegewaldii CCALA 016 TaxID=2107694 RepID=A0A2T1LZE9_9CHRO|nr:DUF1822 family protein [Aphanothece hegewaldii]PSF37741.1 hypothetical protein C7H19_09340 [Aphanothece hegewaldii CCALA 016]